MKNEINLGTKTIYNTSYPATFHHEHTGHKNSFSTHIIADIVVEPSWSLLGSLRSGWGT